MKKTDVSFTLTAKQADFAKDLAIVPIGSKTTVIILMIAACNDYIMGDLDKITIIAAIRADDPTNWFPF